MERTRTHAAGGGYPYAEHSPSYDDPQAFCNMNGGGDMSETKSPLGGLTRRGFLKTTGAVTAVAAVAGTGAALAPMPPLVPPPARLLTPPLVPLARARVVSWVDYRSLSRWASPRPVAFPKQFGNYPARRRRLRALWQRRWEGKQTALTACGCAPIRSLRRFSAIAVSRLRHFGPSGYAALAKTHVWLRVFAPF